MVSLAGGRSLLLMQRISAAVLYRRGISSLFSIPPSPEPAAACRSFPQPVTPWGCQQIRTKARGNEYQPSNLKRKHKHGWIKRIRTRSGIEVILRRMLKGRKSLTH
ncbi:39S ribosomal protein L34, mitochondrial [Lacerta agilis]|uniref:39S ribosomal protein L34, mitochondrial n=1 Tax=Lacerta agilis TaxID=80427 RepID=UPI001419E3EF|nr:39S ribosomal protein L34, mitochondrial [Lacerta agilis]